MSLAEGKQQIVDDLVKCLDPNAAMWCMIYYERSVYWISISSNYQYIVEGCIPVELRANDWREKRFYVFSLSSPLDEVGQKILGHRFLSQQNVNDHERLCGSLQGVLESVAKCCAESCHKLLNWSSEVSGEDTALVEGRILERVEPDAHIWVIAYRDLNVDGNPIVIELTQQFSVVGERVSALLQLHGAGVPLDVKSYKAHEENAAWSALCRAHGSLSEIMMQFLQEIADKSVVAAMGITSQLAELPAYKR